MLRYFCGCGSAVVGSNGHFAHSLSHLWSAGARVNKCANGLPYLGKFTFLGDSIPPPISSRPQRCLRHFQISERGWISFMYVKRDGKHLRYTKQHFLAFLLFHFISRIL